MENDVTTTYLQAAKAGDGHAFARLCETHRARVWRTVATVTRGGPDTDDLAQDAILKAWTALPSYRGDAPFGAWLCRIALNVAHDHLRSAWKRKVFSWGAVFSDQEINQEKTGSHTDTPLAASALPDEETSRREMQRRVREEVAKLKEHERIPIWLIYFEEYSLAEVARLEALPESTVRSRVKAGLKRLERTLADWNFTADLDSDLSPRIDEGFRPQPPRQDRERTAISSIVQKQAAAMGRGYNR